MDDAVTLWHVQAADLPDVTVEPVVQGPGACTHGLHATEADAWRAAARKLQQFIVDTDEEAQAIQAQFNRRIDAGVAAHRKVRERLNELATVDA